MKKIGLVMLIALFGLILVACGGAPTPTAAWADVEELTYDITTTTSKEMLGTLKMTTVRSIPDKSLSGKTYANADSKVIVEYETDQHFIKTTSLLKGYVILATTQEYTDKVDAAENYLLTARHEGKYYYYSYDGGAEKRLNVGKSGYTDSQFIYHFLRSYEISNIPSSVKIAYPAEGTVISVASSYKGTEKLSGIPYPNGARDVTCNIVTVSLSGTPSGKSILVWYTPDTAAENISGLSLHQSKKIPVKMEENDITYSLKSIHVM